MNNPAQANVNPPDPGQGWRLLFDGEPRKRGDEAFIGEEEARVRGQESPWSPVSPGFIDKRWSMLTCSPVRRRLVAQVQPSCSHGYEPEIVDGRVVYRKNGATAARCSPHPPVANPPLLREVTKADVEAVEDAVGMGHGAWDMIDPKNIILAAWALLKMKGGAA